MLPEEILPCLHGVVPSFIGTDDGDGLPNMTIISQVHYVDSEHVAISNQFFSKTSRNLEANPSAVIQVVDPADCSLWILEVEFVRRETEGPLFDEMSMELEAIASMSGMQDLFALQTADVCRVLSVYKQTEAHERV